MARSLDIAERSFHHLEPKTGPAGLQEIRKNKNVTFVKRPVFPPRTHNLDPYQPGTLAGNMVPQVGRHTGDVACLVTLTLEYQTRKNIETLNTKYIFTSYSLKSCKTTSMATIGYRLSRARIMRKYSG